MARPTLPLACALLGASAALADPAPRGVAPAVEAPVTAAPAVAVGVPSLPSAMAAEPPTSATVVFAGDLVPHADVLDAAAAYGAASLLAPLAPVLRAADLALMNLETPVAASRPESRERMRFNVHPRFLDALTAAGVDAVSAANNHAFDQGVAAVAETVSALRRRGVRPVGAALAGEDPLTPEEFPLAGSTLCVLAATRLLNFDMEPPGADRARVALARPEAPAEGERLLDAVRRAHERCGAVLVSLHAGVEYEGRAAAGERAFFRRVAEAGADAVVGHHPHVPLAAEWADVGGRRVPMFYSVGNLLSNQGANAEAVLFEDIARPHVSLDPRTRAGLLAVLRFERRGDRLAVASAGYLPLWTRNAHRPSPDAPPPRLTATLMPREGGGRRGLARVWARTLGDAGEAMLLPAGAVAGAGEAYARGEALAAAGEPDAPRRRSHERRRVTRGRWTRASRSAPGGRRR